MEDHSHCIICERILVKWPGYRWYSVIVDGKTVCYCDGECKEIYEMPGQCHSHDVQVPRSVPCHSDFIRVPR